MVDSAIAILLGVVLVELARFGGFVSANPPTDPKISKNYTFRFRLYAAFAILLVIAQGIRIYQAGKDAEKDRTAAATNASSTSNTLTALREQLRSAQTDAKRSNLQQQFEREQLNNVELMITAFGKSGSDNSAKSLEGIKAIADARVKAQVLSDSELSKRGIDFANRLRKFEFNYERQRSINSFPNNQTMTKEQQDALYRAQNNAYTQMSMQRDHDFKTVYVGEAVYLRDELLARLSEKGEKDIDPTVGPSGLASTKQEIDMVFGGNLAGNPIPLMAGYIEKLARSLTA